MPYCEIIHALNNTLKILSAEINLSINFNEGRKLFQLTWLNNFDLYPLQLVYLDFVHLIVAVFESLG